MTDMIDISARFTFAVTGQADVLLQFEAAAIPEQRLLNTRTTMSHAHHLARVPAHDAIGERIWLHAEGQYEISYWAQVQVNRILADLGTLDQLDTHDLPGEAVQYLFDSRYCPAEQFQHFVDAQFGTLAGGPRVVAMRDWIAAQLRYVPGSSTYRTTALDTFVERRGICRDYTHLMVSLARASAIPARYVSVYAPGVTPQDFHAVAEVFLADPTIPGGGAWHMVDATMMADPAQTVKIGVGRDAADVSFMTSFGDVIFGEKDVVVEALP
jgi:transglutaminase-like putative cysteine protease